MAKFTGDFAEMKLLQANIERLTRVPSKIAAEAAGDIKESIQEEFREGKDPYGNAWNPLQASTIARGRRPPPLTDTRESIESLEVRPRAGAGIEISFSTPWIGFHQTGFHVGNFYVEPRPPLPAGGFPTTWSKAIKDAGEKSVSEAMK